MCISFVPVCIILVLQYILCCVFHPELCTLHKIIVLYIQFIKSCMSQALTVIQPQDIMKYPCLNNKLSMTHAIYLVINKVNHTVTIQKKRIYLILNVLH